MGQEEFKKPKIYFQEKTEANINTAIIDKNEIKEKVKLLISLEDCIPGTNYQIKIDLLYNQKKEFLFETEKLKPNSEDKINYDTTFLLTYYFEKEQLLYFNIDINGEIIEFKTTLGCIVGSKNSTLVRKIEKNRNEKIKIKSTKVDSSNKKLKINFKIKDDKKPKKFASEDKFFFLISSDKDLYRSELISSDGFFKPANIPIYFLTPSFSITFYNLKQEILKQFPDLNCDKIIKMNREEFPLIYNSKKQKTTDIYVNAEILGTEKTFLDYIEEGMQINLEIAIDFSKTNINLHKTIKNKMNRYEEAIKYCGDIVAYYDSDQLFPAFGFGADNVPEKYNRMCFPINLNDDPNIAKIDGVLEEYKNCLKKITLSEPSEFTPVIKHITGIIREEENEENNNNYHILLLLTDGKYNDREKTIDAIVEASKLPMSIIIIGLEDSDLRPRQDFDIIYMIDATGSMGSYLQAAKDQCINISNELKTKFNNYDYQFGGIFYRDPIDSNSDKNDMFDLNDDVPSLKSFISKMEAYGGGDLAEDWAGGYDLAVNKIKWRNGLRLIIHICDADAHGRDYSTSGDNHPDEGIKMPPLLQQCVDKNIKIIGFNIKNKATTSFNQCKIKYEQYDVNKKGLYKIQDFNQTGDISNTFKELVVEAAAFAAMEELDGDEQPLVSSSGEKWERDIVQFVPYDKFKHNPRLLAEQVLEEIPAQVVGYCKNKNIKNIQKEGFIIVE